MRPRAVLFVCLGNICRSPVAEGVFRQTLQSHLPEESAQWLIDSAGTSDHHQGDHPDLRSMAHAASQGLDISMLESRPFTAEDFQRFDHILVMDDSNLSNVLSLASSDADRSKVSLMLEVSFPGENCQVPDPYYGGDQGFQVVYDLLTQASADWLSQWQN